MNATAFLHLQSKGNLKQHLPSNSVYTVDKTIPITSKAKMLVYVAKEKRDLCQNGKENLLQYKISSTGVLFLDNKDRPGYERGY